MMITGLMFRDGVISGSNNIANNRQAVDALNIFPVPDGDTGTNMSMTIGAAAKEMAVLPENCTVEEASAAVPLPAAGRPGQLRRNSFADLPRLFQGAAWHGRSGRRCRGRCLSQGRRRSLQSGDEAYGGTILTVIRKAAEAAEQIAASNNDAWTVCCAAMAAAEEALAKTPEQLPVLKKAGVVDAGGQGLVLIFQGMGAVLEKGTVVQPIAGSAVTPVQTPDKSTVAAASGEIEFGYCSEFLIEKDRHAPQQDPLRLRAYLESIGDCVVVVDDSDIIKVHVHSNCPGDVIQAALKYGQLINIKIDNMRYQHRNAEEGVKQGDASPQPTVVQPENDYGFVAVCAGDGLKELFTDIGADTVVSGGQTMNPSTDDILNAIMATPAKTVFVLPNNKNIIMAAEQAIPLAKDRQVRVLQTKTIPQGISAMLVFDETQSADDNQMAMMDAAAHVETGSVTFAARDSELDGRPIKQGEIMGMCGSKIKFLGDDIVDIAFKTVDKLFKRGEHALVTLIYGADATEEQAQELETRLSEKYGSDMEISIVDGGQPIYYFLLSVE